MSSIQHRSQVLTGQSTGAMFDIEWAGAAAGADQSPLDHSQF